jgi:hypothetical protein
VGTGFSVWVSIFHLSVLAALYYGIITIYEFWRLAYDKILQPLLKISKESLNSIPHTKPVTPTLQRKPL